MLDGAERPGLAEEFAAAQEERARRIAELGTEAASSGASTTSSEGIPGNTPIDARPGRGARPRLARTTSRGEWSGWPVPKQLPFDRPGPMGVAPEFRELQLSGEIARVRTFAGSPAWLVTRREDVIGMLSDDRFGRVHPDPAAAPVLSATGQFYGPQGTDHERLEAEFRTLRHATANTLSVRRVREMRPRIEALVGRRLDRMAAEGPPADLHALLAEPLPVEVVCELLGVPYADREDFGRWTADVVYLGEPERVGAALTGLNDYVRALMARKREEPAEDALTDLVRAQADGLVGEDLAVLWAVALLFAGHVTTVTRIGTGVRHLLAEPGQRAAMLTGPEALAETVEELLRIGQPDLGLVWRWAVTEVDTGRGVIAPGDLVLFANGPACLDPTAYPDPERFDLSHARTPHTAFGAGPHLCVGAALARMELQVVLDLLFRRFPGLRLAVPDEELPWRESQLTGGLRALPVAW
ncbi:cytochrome P450 [Kitasatospora sp. NPDC101183]|uniref:cytochrome P450 n=1 Tax=Kitasatospora sp. NPDC101183 TaxID=3364100 RepID=UPI0037FF5657